MSCPYCHCLLNQESLTFDCDCSDSSYDPQTDDYQTSDDSMSIYTTSDDSDDEIDLDDHESHDENESLDQPTIVELASIGLDLVNQLIELGTQYRCNQ